MRNGMKNVVDNNKKIKGLWIFKIYWNTHISIVLIDDADDISENVIRIYFMIHSDNIIRRNSAKYMSVYACWGWEFSFFRIFVITSCLACYIILI